MCCDVPRVLRVAVLPERWSDDEEKPLFGQVRRLQCNKQYDKSDNDNDHTNNVQTHITKAVTCTVVQSAAYVRACMSVCISAVKSPTRNEYVYIDGNS